MLPCDGYPKPVSVDRPTPQSALSCNARSAASCGAPVHVTLPLVATTVTSDLPAEIAHDPLGPAITPDSGARTPGDPSRVLRPLRPDDNGNTIQTSVGSVVVLPELNGANPDVSAGISSDPSVVGGLDGTARNVNGEFRAWSAGRADLTIPTSGCAYPTSNEPPCTGSVDRAHHRRVKRCLRAAYASRMARSARRHTPRYESRPSAASHRSGPAAIVTRSGTAPQTDTSAPRHTLTASW